jgi:hypothetical protein
MSEAAQHSAAGAEGEALPPQARFLAGIAIASALTQEAATLGKSSGPAELAVILDNICEFATWIGNIAADTADVLGCGPETVEAVRLGKGRLDSFRACRGMEGSA